MVEKFVASNPDGLAPHQRVLPRYSTAFEILMQILEVGQPELPVRVPHGILFPPIVPPHMKIRNIDDK